MGEPTYSRAICPRSSSKIARMTASSSVAYAAQPIDSTGHWRSHRVRLVQSACPSAVVGGPSATRSDDLVGAAEVGVHLDPAHVLRRDGPVLELAEKDVIRAAR